MPCGSTGASPASPSRAWTTSVRISSMKANSMRRRQTTGFMISLGLAMVFGCDRRSPTSATNDKPASASLHDESAERLPEIRIDEPTGSNPLTVAAAISPAVVRPGQRATLSVRAKTADSWHIYAFDHDGVGVPMQLSLELPSGLELEGEWEAPAATVYPSVPPGLVLEGDLTFRHHLKVASDAPTGRSEIKCTVQYQACNASLCNPPQTTELTAVLNVR